jgi:hypothetical protein
MRKFAFVASAAFIAAAFGGGWMSTTTTAFVAPPANGAGIDPIQIMVGSPNLPTQHFVDYSLIYPSN